MGILWIFGIYALILTGAIVALAICVRGLFRCLSPEGQKRVCVALWGMGRKKAEDLIDKNVDPTIKVEVKEIADAVADELKGETKK